MILSVDNSWCLQPGISGLEELIAIDSQFSEYEKTLFSDSATSIQRLTQTPDANHKIDETIKLYLLQLSPYFLLRSAHKTLEWLIYR